MKTSKIRSSRHCVVSALPVIGPSQDRGEAQARGLKHRGKQASREDVAGPGRVLDVLRNEGFIV